MLRSWVFFLPYVPPRQMDPEFRVSHPLKTLKTTQTDAEDGRLPLALPVTAPVRLGAGWGWGP